MAQKRISKQELRTTIIDTVTELSRAVTSTMGPKGRTVAIRNGRIPGQQDTIFTTKDGVTVARNFFPDSPVESAIADMVKKSAINTNINAGDGTTTATLLTEKIVTTGFHLCGNFPYSRSRVVDGMKFAAKMAADYLRTLSSEVSGDDIERVAEISANGDKTIGPLIREAMDKVGLEGVIRVQPGFEYTTSMTIHTGVRFKRGFKTPSLLSGRDERASRRISLENAYIFMYEKKLADTQDLLPLLQKFSTVYKGKSLVIIAGDITGTALQTIVLNRIQAPGLNVVPVQMQDQFSDRGREFLEDIAALTGGKAITEDDGIVLSDPNCDAIVNIGDYLGRADLIEISEKETIIQGGKGSPDDLAIRIAEIRGQKKESFTPMDEEFHQFRLASLVGGIAVIRVGGRSDVEVQELLHRYEDALNATRAAVEEGIVPGAGTAYLRIKQSPEWQAALDSIEDEAMRVGFEIVDGALGSVLRKLLANCEWDQNIYKQVIEAEEWTIGLNASGQEPVLECLFTAGVIDPTKVVRTALENAVSISGELLKMNYLFVDDKDQMAGNPLAGLMGGMG